MPEKEWASWTDPLGATYAPGDLIAYPATQGSSAVMRFGYVVRINSVNSSGQPIMRWHWEGKTKVETPSATVTLIEVEASTGLPKKGYSWNTTKSGKPRLKTIHNIDNIVAVSNTPDDIDGTVAKLMELHESLEGGNE